MPTYSVYISPVKKTTLLFLALFVLLLYFKPSYVISYVGIWELDWSNVNTFWVVIGSFLGLFLLFNLIPGLYLGNEYFRFDKAVHKRIQQYPLQAFKKSIRKVDCVNSYIEGKWTPGAIHADYWYYNIQLDDGQDFKASRFLAEQLDLFEFFDRMPNHLYTVFPSMKWEEEAILKDIDYTSVGPSEGLIQHFENRYMSHSREKLMSISHNDSYRREARIAASNLLTKGQKKA